MTTLAHSDRTALSVTSLCRLCANARPSAVCRHDVRQTAEVKKTTVYLPLSLVQRVKAIAAAKHVSEASVIRSAIELYTETVERPRPRVAIYETERPIADWDEALRGFGKR